MDKKINTKKIIEFKKTRLKFPITEELATRFSPRFFKEDKIDSRILDSIFEAARWAPSAYNYQPWYFYWTQKNSAFYKKIFSCLSERNEWAKTAPVFVVACYLKKREGHINKFAQYDLGSSTMSIITQAQSLGIYARQMGLFNKEKLQSFLKISRDYVPFVVIAIGKIGDYKKIDKNLLERELQKRTRKVSISKKI
ncbi:MAG: nitroreductase family protein [Patescibacteria group bacterium]